MFVYINARRAPTSTRTDTLFPATTLFGSSRAWLKARRTVSLAAGAASGMGRRGVYFPLCPAMAYESANRYRPLNSSTASDSTRNRDALDILPLGPDQFSAPAVQTRTDRGGTTRHRCLEFLAGRLKV